jgi:hypothetical protein
MLLTIKEAVVGCAVSVGCGPVHLALAGVLVLLLYLGRCLGEGERLSSPLPSLALTHSGRFSADFCGRLAQVLRRVGVAGACSQDIVLDGPCQGLVGLKTGLDRVAHPHLHTSTSVQSP